MYGIEPRYIDNDDELVYNINFVNFASFGKLLENNELYLYENNTDHIYDLRVLHYADGTISKWVYQSLCINSTEFYEKVGRELSTHAIGGSSIQLLIMGCDSKARNCLHNVTQIQYTANTQFPMMNLSDFRKSIIRTSYSPKYKLNLSKNTAEIPLRFR